MSDSTWVVIALIAFLAGIVANIVRPTRRGVLGFVASGTVSVFCGTVAAISTELDLSNRVVIAAVVGILSDKILDWVLNFEIAGKVVNYNQINTGNGQGNQGQNITDPQNKKEK